MKMAKTNLMPAHHKNVASANKASPLSHLATHVRLSLRSLRSDKIRSFLSVLGILIGVGGTQIVARLQHLPFLLLPMAIFAATMLSIVLGLLFGVYPAWKASMTDPIDALRD